MPQRARPSRSSRTLRTLRPPRRVTRSTTMRLTEECRARLIGIAAANGVSMSAMIERMVREWQDSSTG